MPPEAKNQELQGSLEGLAAALREAEAQSQKHAAAAKAANEQLQHFVYAASHDLQAPLQTILRYTQLLEPKYAGDPEAREFADFIIADAKRMLSLLQDLLAYSRVGTSKRRTVIPLKLPLQWALLRLAIPIRDAAAEITQGDLPEVFADESEMAQLFENVLGNALKFRNEAKIEIAVTAEEGSGEYMIAVRDNGPGIDPQYLEQVLLPFKRLHGKGIPGSGIGLAVCEKIVRAHDGRIWLESDGQRGTTVKFTLPI